MSGAKAAFYKFFGQVAKRNSVFIGFFACTSFSVQYIVVKSVDILWETHNYKRSFAYLESNIEKWKLAEAEEEN